jgi:orotate phosphoribosyltransferase
METYKQKFIEFMVRAGALTFGDFTTKSGRRTPFFINTGRYDTGEKMARLGHFYAEALVATLGDEFDNLYGPAYKGIPLCVAAAIALARDKGRDVSYTFNRKEVKDHGEGGGLVGHVYRGGERVVIVEDVVTAGTSVRETVKILRAAVSDSDKEVGPGRGAVSRAAVPGGGVDLRAVVVSVDRMERGTGARSALAEIAETLGVRTFAIVTIEEVVAHLREHPVDCKQVLDAGMLERIAAYRAEYGAA